MTKNQQRSMAMVRNSIRRLTIGMVAETDHRDIHEIGEDGKPVYNLLVRDRFGVILTPSTFRAAISMPRKWELTPMVYWVDVNNVPHIEAAETIIADEMLFKDLTEIYKTSKADAYSSVNPNFIVGFGWKAKALN